MTGPPATPVRWRAAIGSRVSVLSVASSYVTLTTEKTGVKVKLLVPASRIDCSVLKFSRMTVSMPVLTSKLRGRAISPAGIVSAAERPPGGGIDAAHGEPAVALSM